MLILERTVFYNTLAELDCDVKMEKRRISERYGGGGGKYGKREEGSNMGVVRVEEDNGNKEEEADAGNVPPLTFKSSSHPSALLQISSHPPPFRYPPLLHFHITIQLRPCIVQYRTFKYEHQ